MTKLASVLGVGILEIVEVEHRLAAIDAAGDGRDMVLQHLELGKHLARLPSSFRQS
jgi:hypothetical protein